MPLEKLNKLETVDRNEVLDYFQQKGLLPNLDKNFSNLDSNEPNPVLKTMLQVTDKESGLISNKEEFGYYESVAFTEKRAYQSKSLACEWVKDNNELKLLVTYVDEDHERRQRNEFLTCLLSFDKGNNQFDVEILPGFMDKFKADLEKFKEEGFLPFLGDFCNKANQKEDLIEVSKENIQGQSQKIRYDYQYLNLREAPACRELQTALAMYGKPIISQEKFDSLTNISEQLAKTVKEFKKNDNYRDNWEIRDKNSQRIQELVTFIEKNKYVREEVKTALREIERCLDNMKKYQPSWQERGVIQMLQDALRYIFTLGSENSYKDKYAAVLQKAKHTVDGLNNNSSEIKDKEKQNYEEATLSSTSPRLHS